MSASEPRTSATRRSLVVEACAQTALSACGNEITYAVGCGRALDAPSLSAWASEGERDSGAEGMSTFGRRSQTMSILSSEEWVLSERGQASKEGLSHQRRSRRSAQSRPSDPRRTSCRSLGRGGRLAHHQRERCLLRRRETL